MKTYSSEEGFDEPNPDDSEALAEPSLSVDIDRAPPTKKKRSLNKRQKKKSFKHLKNYARCSYLSVWALMSQSNFTCKFTLKGPSFSG